MGEITPTIGIIIAVILALLNELQCNNAFIHVKTTPTIQVRRLMLVSAGARSRKQLTPASIALNAHNVYSKDESPVETTVREAAALVPPGPMQLHMIMNRKSAGAGLNHVNGTQAASKLRQLKDRMWVRETMEDITAAEFAARLGCHRDIDGVEETRQQMGRTINAVDDGVLREVESNVGASVASASSVSPAGGGLFNKRKRAVDFENLLHKLNRRVQEMCVEGELSSIDDVGNSEGAKCYTLDEMRDDAHSVGTGELCYTLVVDKGMGSVVYSPEQRKALLL